MLFALIAFTTLPEIEIILKNEKKNMKKTILISYAIIFSVYLLFTLIVLGTMGKDTPQISTLALGKVFILLGILTMGTSYLALTIAFVDILRMDYKKPKKISWLYAIIPPLIIYVLLSFFNLASFTKILSVGGLISGGLMGVLILFMVKNAKLKGDVKPEYQIPYSKILTWVIILILAIGTIMEILNSFS